MTGQEALGALMLLVMLAAIFIGLPISFTLLFLALIFGFIGMEWRVFDLAYLQIFSLMKQDEFVAVPMFILMGYVCDQAGLISRLFKAFRDLFAPMRGALYVVVILTATLFGIAAGTVGATVTLLGIIAGPLMIKAGYDTRLSAGSITAGGTLGILIPPSVMLVVMAPVLEVSIVDLYAAAFGPGFLLSAMYIAYALFRSYMNPKVGPPVPLDERQTSFKVVLWECVVGLVPVTILTIVTLGAILAGITTAAEAAALGALGAILLVAAYGEFTVKGLVNACYMTLATSSMVLFLAVSSNVFGSVFSWLGTASWLTKMLLAAPLPAWGTMALLLGLIFLLGWPFEWPAIVLIFLPLLAPVAKGLGYDMVWFACIVAVVLQTAFLSPPVAMSAYYLKQVVKEWNLATIYRGMADFMVIQVICVVLVMVYPSIAMWFPHWLQERTKAERMRDKGEVPAKPMPVAAANGGAVTR
ncbi:MAG: TRAP transporter large permease subunit [Burkholderiales bacterium]